MRGGEVEERTPVAARGISVVILRPIAECLERSRKAGANVSAALGISNDAPADLFVPSARVNAALRQIESGPLPLSLEVLAAAPVGALGLFDYLLIASRNLEEALDGFRRLYGLLTQIVSLRIERDGRVVRICHDIHRGADRVPLMTELAFAALHDRARRAIGARWAPLAVRFTHRVPVATARALEAYFGCDVTFEQSRDEVAFDAAALTVPFPTADPATASFLRERAARLQVPGAEADDDDLGDVRAALALMRGRRHIRLANLAKALRTSPRSLQRRLRQKGTSLRQLVADTQKALALKLAEDPKLSLGEIAYELGFSEHASFHRAFVRWTGTTPGDHRARLASKRRA